MIQEKQEGYCPYSKYSLMERRTLQLSRDNKLSNYLSAGVSVSLAGRRCCTYVQTPKYLVSQVIQLKDSLFFGDFGDIFKK